MRQGVVVIVEVMIRRGRRHGPYSSGSLCTLESEQSRTDLCLPGFDSLKQAYEELVDSADAAVASALGASSPSTCTAASSGPRLSSAVGSGSSGMSLGASAMISSPPSAVAAASP